MKKILLGWVTILVIWATVATAGAVSLAYGTDAWAAPASPTLTRGQFYTMLAMTAQAEMNQDISTNLTDVQSGQPYTTAIIWAMTNGLADYPTTTEFGTDSPIPRWEIAQALFRYHRNVAPVGLTAKYALTTPDLGGLTQESITAIGYCCGTGVMSSTDGLFHPYDTVTFAQGVEILGNVFDLTTVFGATFLYDAPQPWTGNWQEDFPLSQLETIDVESVLALNQRILGENQPAYIAAYGTSVDNVASHLTNYGALGIYDCYHTTTIRANNTANVAEGLELLGQQQYYGYALQIIGIDSQDTWHQAAADTGKDPWQCTWWAWGRAAQYMELRYDMDLLAFCDDNIYMGNGQDYFDSLSDYFHSDQTPSANSIVSWAGSSYGHVAYVEAVDDNGIWVSMADSGRTWRGITYIPKSDNPENPYPLGWYPDEEFLGFNHLDQPLS